MTANFGEDERKLSMAAWLESGGAKSVLDEMSAQRIRIEALRAAARIVGDIAAERPLMDLDGAQAEIPPAIATIVIAKQFAAYLESGE